MVGRTRYILFTQKRFPPPPLFPVFIYSAGLPLDCVVLGVRCGVFMCLAVSSCVVCRALCLGDVLYGRQGG